MTADSILTACLQVRLQLQLGEVDGADRRLEILESRIRFVDSRLTRRFFMAGFKAVEGGRDGARRSHGSAAARRSRTAKGKKVRAAWAAERANGKTKTEADEVVALKFKISTKTVRNFRAEK
jgi:hypothetical protein